MRSPRALAILSLLCSIGLAGAARAEVIYQAFDEPFSTVKHKVGHLKDLGYSVIQVSPPQKSIDLGDWWARYQPVDLREISGPLGNESDLKSLIDSAHGAGLKVIVDVVTNHMADPRYLDGDLSYPEFSAQDFHYPDTRPCIGDDYNDRWRVTNHWLCDHRASLPDLDTSKPYVRGVHKRYLKKLLALGADGFRFDAVKHIEPEYFADVLGVVPHGKFFYGEVIGETLQEHQIYTHLMPVTDFQLLRTLLSAFSLGGDLRYLIHPEGFGAALPAANAVVFARNHDTVMHPGFFNFGDRQDAMLAYAYAIGRGAGHALVYRDDADDRSVVGAIRFRRATQGAPANVRRVEEVCDGDSACNPTTLLVMEKGDKGVMLINKSDAWVDAPRASFPGLAEGCYADVHGSFRIAVARGGDGRNWVSAWGSYARGGLNIGPRSAVFLVRSSHCP